jgi:hypothetical protein
MYSPNHLLFSSQLYILVELLQKHAAAAKRNGVVGKIGSTIPIAPKHTQINPARSQSAFAIVIFCPLFSQRVASEDVPLSNSWSNPCQILACHLKNHMLRLSLCTEMNVEMDDLCKDGTITLSHPTQKQRGNLLLEHSQSRIRRHHRHETTRPRSPPNRITSPLPLYFRKQLLKEEQSNDSPSFFCQTEEKEKRVKKPRQRKFKAVTPAANGKWTPNKRLQLHAQSRNHAELYG